HTLLTERVTYRATATGPQQLAALYQRPVSLRPSASGIDQRALVECLSLRSGGTRTECEHGGESPNRHESGFPIHASTNRDEYCDESSNAWSWGRASR